MPPIHTLEVKTRKSWRRWLDTHHDSKSEIWLIFNKRHTGVQSITYDDAVEEALCFGWIDSLIKRIDDSQFARKFTPRKPESAWSAVNRRRYADLQSRGLLMEAGRARQPGKCRNARYAAPTTVPDYIEKAFKKNPKAEEFFEALAPSYKRTYVGWIDSAKRLETQQRRLQEALRVLAAGKKLGLK